MAAALLALALQSDVDRWIADLASDDVETRDAAEAALVKTRARDAVTKVLASSDAEVRARAERILRQIEDDVEVEAFLAVPRVSAAYDKKPLAVVLADWSKASGHKIACDALPETPVTLAFDDVPLPEALDRLCASLYRVNWRSANSGRIRVGSGDPVSKPVAYVGPFRLLLSMANEKPVLTPQFYRFDLKFKHTLSIGRATPTELRDVEGAIEVDLPVGSADVALRKENIGKPFDIGEVTLQIKSWNEHSVNFTLIRPDSNDESARIIDGAVEVVELGGKTTRGTLGYADSIFVPPDFRKSDAACFVTLPERTQVNEVRFKLRPRTKRVQLPFKIDRIEFGK